MIELFMRLALIFINCSFLFMAGFALFVLANIVIKPDDHNKEIIMRIINGIPGICCAFVVMILSYSLYIVLFDYPLALNFVLNIKG